MHTKHEIQRLLAATGRNPNKRLGQNFLVDLNLIRLLVEAAQLGPEDVVLEVGCGTGSLTQELAQKAGQVVAVEVDTALADIARTQLNATPHVHIVQADILATKHRLHNDVIKAIQETRQGQRGRFLLVANLPYHVACPVILNLVQNEPHADAMFVTVQKEVADRMTAPVGSHEYGALRIFLAATGTTQRLRVLKPTVFWPPPRVVSAMVHFQRDPVRVAQIRDSVTLVTLVNLFMQHRRKMVKAAVKTATDFMATIPWREAFGATRINPMSRPDQITPDQFVQLANWVTIWSHRYNML